MRAFRTDKDVGISLTFGEQFGFVRNVIYEQKATKRHLKKISGCSRREHLERWRTERLLRCKEEAEKLVFNDRTVSLEFRSVSLYESSYVLLVGNVHVTAMAESEDSFQESFLCVHLIELGSLAFAL